MKIFPYVDFKDKKDRKTFFGSLVVFIAVSQLMGSISWFLFDTAIFIPLLFGALGGFIFGYKGIKKEKEL